MKGVYKSRQTRPAELRFHLTFKLQMHFVVSTTERLQELRVFKQGGTAPCERHRENGTSVCAERLGQWGQEIFQEGEGRALRGWGATL